jgi:molybdenum cofactor biosynthesis enzyme MoaA
MAHTLKSVLEADTLKEMADLLGGEEMVLRIIKYAYEHKEQQRLSHKKAYLKRQMILQKAKEAGITADED